MKELLKKVFDIRAKYHITRGEFDTTIDYFTERMNRLRSRQRLVFEVCSYLNEANSGLIRQTIDGVLLSDVANDDLKDVLANK